MSTKTIKASGGDYTTLTAWFNSLPATLTEPEIAVVDAFDLVDAVYITGKTQSAANYIEIRANPAQRHLGVRGVGARVRCAGSGTAPLRINMPYVRVVGFEVFQDGSASQQIVSYASGAAGGDCYLDECLIHDGTTLTGIDGNYAIFAAIAGLNLKIRNTVVPTTRRGIDSRGAANVRLENCTFHCRTGQLGIVGDLNTHVYNTYASPGFYFDTSGDNNVSSDTSAFTRYGAGSISSVAASAAFESVTVGSENYMPQAGSVLLNAGQVIAGVTTDVLGTARPQGAAYDIGAFEFASAAGASSTITATLGNVTATGSSFVSPKATITATLGSLTFAGSASSGQSTGILATLGAVIFVGSSAGLIAAGTISTLPLFDLTTKTAKANQTGVIIAANHRTSGALVVQLTGQTTDASGVCTFTNAALVPGTSYRIYQEFTDGTIGCWPYTAV